MILNAATVLAFFLAAVGGLLAAAAFLVAVPTWWKVRRVPAERWQHDRIERREHLLLLLLGVLGLVRLAAWPNFYWLMMTYVAPLAPSGVMCVFGVTRIEADLVLALQIIKPVALLGIGLWWLTAQVGRRAATRVLVSPRLYLAALAAGLALADCWLEVEYLLREKAVQRVTCCTQFLSTDAAVQPTASSFGSGLVDSAPPVLAGYAALNLFVIAACVYLRRHGLPRNRLTGMTVAALAAAAGAVNLLAAHWAWREALAPKVLQLPYHHCIYELITETPALGFAAAMTVIGNGCLGWPVVLQLWRRRAPDAVAATQQQVYEFSALILASALLIAGVHGV